jgi:fructose-bisphosphate aldolase class II
MHQNSSAFDPREYLKEATKVMTEICVARYEACWTARDASSI